jgi:hypothetical protein
MNGAKFHSVLWLKLAELARESVGIGRLIEVRRVGCRADSNAALVGQIAQ